MASSSRQVGGDLAGQRAVRAGGQGEPGVGALAFARQQAGIAEQFQVAGQAGLRLAEDFGEFGDAEGAARGEREQAQAGRFRGGAERGEQGIHREVNDIKICLCLGLLCIARNIQGSLLARAKMNAAGLSFAAQSSFS